MVLCKLKMTAPKGNWGNVMMTNPYLEVEKGQFSYKHFFFFIPMALNRTKESYGSPGQSSFHVSQWRICKQIQIHQENSAWVTI